MLRGDGLDIHTAHTAEYQSRTLDALLSDGQIIFFIRLHHFLGEKTMHAEALDSHIQDLAEIFPVFALILAYTHAAGLSSAAGHDLCLENEREGHGNGVALGTHQNALRQWNAVLAQQSFSFKFK